MIKVLFLLDIERILQDEKFSVMEVLYIHLRKYVR